jgi:hypothetical protein
MRLLGQRDLKATATAADAKVTIKLGGLRYTASRTEAIAFAAEIVRAVDELDGPELPGLA